MRCSGCGPASGVGLPTPRTLAGPVHPLSGRSSPSPRASSILQDTHHHFLTNIQFWCGAIRRGKLQHPRLQGGWGGTLRSGGIQLPRIAGNGEKLRKIADLTPPPPPTLPTVTKCGLSCTRTNAHKHSRRRPTSHSQASETDGREDQTRCLHQHDNPWPPPPPPPERAHKGQDVPQMAPKKFGGGMSAPK